MSSEAVVYFPDAMVSVSEAGGSVHCAPETTSNSVTEAQQQNEIPRLSGVVFTPTSEISNELLMEQVRQGAKDALTLIFRRHARAGTLALDRTSAGFAVRARAQRRLHHLHYRDSVFRPQRRGAAGNVHRRSRRR